MIVWVPSAPFTRSSSNHSSRNSFPEIVNSRTISNRDHLDPQWQAQYGKNLPPHVLDAIERARSETQDKDEHENA